MDNQTLETISILVIEGKHDLASRYVDLYNWRYEDIGVQFLSLKWDIPEEYVWKVLDTLKELGLVQYFKDSVYTISYSLSTYRGCLLHLPHESILKPDFIKWRNRFYEMSDVIEISLWIDKHDGKKHTQEKLEQMWCKAMKEKTAIITSEK